MLGLAQTQMLTPTPQRRLVPWPAVRHPSLVKLHGPILIATQTLEIELIRSQQMRKHFLIATFFWHFAPRPAPHPSLVTHPSSPPHLISIQYK
jgi:hypothetical protein